MDFYRELFGWLVDYIRASVRSLPVLASQQGQEVDHVILLLHGLMIALFVGWLAFFIYTMIRFRRSRNPKADYRGARSHTSTYLEGAVALLEGVLLVGFSIPFWARAVEAFPKESESTVIRVTAEQFSWQARYPGPDGVFGRQDPKFLSAENPLAIDQEDPHAKDDFYPAANEIVVPVDKPVIIQLTSKDVVHSFKVSPLRITQDAIPGLLIPIHFTPNRKGRYQIQCAQLCGNSHYFMRGFFSVVSSEEYATWQMRQQKGTSGASGPLE
jgi:cytochrome c oxidase subunit 2